MVWNNCLGQKYLMYQVIKFKTAPLKQNTQKYYDLVLLRRDRLGSIAASTESIAFFISYLFIIIFRSNMTMIFKSVVVVLIAILFIDEASANTCPRLVKLKESSLFRGSK